mmetsp:Transcript_958/g.2994  ORF Transcript_958/g.2994 Transcript_958/m.2994 type:complete len:239 (-) Transcript_958:830-1546(-)
MRRGTASETFRRWCLEKRRSPRRRSRSLRRTGSRRLSVGRRRTVLKSVAPVRKRRQTALTSCPMPRLRAPGRRSPRRSPIGARLLRPPNWGRSLLPSSSPVCARMESRREQNLKSRFLRSRVVRRRGMQRAVLRQPAGRPRSFHRRSLGLSPGRALRAQLRPLARRAPVQQPGNGRSPVLTPQQPRGSPSFRYPEMQRSCSCCFRRRQQLKTGRWARRARMRRLWASRQDRAGVSSPG